MPSSRKLLARFSRFVLPSTSRYRRAALFLAAVFLFAGVAAYAANQVTTTITGTITSGTDLEGTFGTVNANLAGKSYSIVFNMDDSQGTTYLGTWPTCNNGLQNSGTSTPVANAVLTIGGNSHTFGAAPYTSVTSYVSSSNYTSPLTELYHSIDSSFTSGGMSGSEDAASEININSATYCRNWESTFPSGGGAYALVSGDTTSGTFSADYYGGGLSPIADFALAYTVTNVAVSGPTTLGLLTTSTGANWGCNCGDTNQQSALPFQAVSISQGDPINAGVGNMTMSETDFVGGPATHLSFTRSYNSHDTGQSGFGIGWRSTYHRALNLSTSTTSITVTRADGRQDIFTKSGSNWVPQANVTSALASTSTNYKLTWPNDTVENYNTSGQLTSVVERSGLTTSLAYTTSGLHVVTGPFGHTLTFTYDSSNRVSTMTLPDGTNKFTYGYDNYNNLASVENPDATYHQYGHGAFPFHNLITDIYDEDGNPYAHWTYDSTGRALTSQHANPTGVDLTTVTYTSSTASTVTDANGNAHNYTLTSLFGKAVPTAVAGVPDLSAGGAAFTYDANGFLSSRTDYDSNVTEYTHNASGEETSRTEAYGTGLARTTTTKWSSTFHLPTEIDAPLGRTTTFGYDTHGNLLTIGMTDGTHNRTWTWTYNGNAQPTSMKDALGNTTTWTYDGTGDVATMVNPLNQTTTYNAYDGNGRLLSLTNPLNLTTTFSYDKRGRELTKKVGSYTWTYAWDAASNKLSSITMPDTSSLTYTYDDAHRLIQVKDYAGDATKYTYDNASNLKTVNVYNPTPTLELTHSYTYDTQNRMVGSIGASMSETTTYSYDSQGNLLSVEDPNSHYMVYTYDDLNRLSTVENPYSGITTYGYDAEDDVTSIKDPLTLTTTYTYDGLGDQRTVVSPDTGTTTNSYNAMGLLLTTTDARGKSASYTYDALNRTATVSYSGGTSIGYTYDTGTYGTGHLTKMVDPAGTTSWTYDQYGDVLGKTQVANSISLTTTHTYDSYGRPYTLKYPSGASIEYSYDTSGRVSAVVNSVTLNNYIGSVTYLPFGMASGWSEANGSTYTRGIDQDGAITSIALASTTTANTQTITYDPAHRITGLTETGLNNKTYGYDSFDRLTAFFNGTATGYYTYDADSNRTSYALSGTTTYHYPGPGNRLGSLTGTTTVSYGYDASGDLTGDGTNTWTYDSRRRMATLAAGTTTASYGINGFGQRITKSGSGVPSGGTNEFVYDEQGNFLGEYGSTGTIIEETVYLPNTPVSVLSKGLGIAGFGTATPVAVLTGASGGTVSSVTSDWLGAPHIIQNSSKTVEWSWDHYAFGDNAPNQNPFGLGTWNYNPRFPGQYKDSETNTNYNTFRDYNPTTGRYIESDPLGLQAGINTYGYVAGNPLTNIDPKGLECVTSNGTVKCWTTAQERQFLNNGNYLGYYNQACADGDNYACFAYDIAADDNAAGDAAKWWFKGNQSFWGKSCFIDEDESYQQISSDLANDYANYLPQSEADAITPSANAIAQFHWSEFAKYGLPPMTFGGTPFGPTIGPIGTKWLWPQWCPDCQ